jgi:CHAT domain-containing protein/tetratricopeptide (TPR) repeat protein
MQQNLNDILNSQVSNNEKEKELYHYLEKIEDQSPEHQADAYYSISKWHWTKNNNENKAILLAEKELQIRLSQESIDSDELRRNLYNLGYFYRNSTFPNYAKALAHLNHLIRISPESEKRLGKVYREKGDIYDSRGDFQKALDNYQLSLSQLKKQNNFSGLLITHTNISATYANLNDPKYADNFFKNQQAIKKLEESIEISPLKKARLHLNHGIILGTIKNMDSAKAKFDLALSIALAEKDDDLTFKTLTAIGVHHSTIKNYKLASDYIHKSELYTNDDPYLKGIVYDNLADIFLRSQQFEMAILNYDKAINALITNNNPVFSQQIVPNINDISLSPFKRDILDYLIHKSTAWIDFYKHTQQKEHLIQAEKSITLADKTIDLLFSESSEELSKLFWRQKGALIYLKGVYISHKLDDPYRALYYMEKNKGLLLLENFNDKLALELAQIPQDQIEVKNDLLKEIKTLQKSLAEQIRTKNRSAIDSLRTAIVNKKDNFNGYIEALEKQYATYSKFKSRTGIPTPDQLIKSIAPNEAILEYIIGDTMGYILIATPSEIALQPIDKFEDLLPLVNQYKEDISKPLITAIDIKKFQKNAFELFNIIIPPNAYNNHIKNRSICIIPDGLLQAIPFESLTTSDGSIPGNNYLIESNNLYYKYSLSLSEATKKINISKEKDPIAFIPTNYASNYLPELNYGIREVNTLKPIFQKNIITNNLATKAEFLKAYDMYNVLHISTHGGVLEGKPWLGFYDKKLLLDELFYIENSKSLVILSACKTSVGTIKKGEGTFNLSRGFLNSGARSVISTLWEVNEKSSLHIIDEFYNNLSQGNNTSEALRLSKLAYLDVHKKTSQASPYFWSGIILTGENSTLDINNNKGPWYLYIFYSVFLFIIVVLGFKRLRSKRPSNSTQK